MTKVNRSQIISPSDYEHALRIIEELLKKGDDKDDEELAIIIKASQLVHDYEEKNDISVIPRTKELLSTNDRKKIADVLGFEPDLIELVEFKMYQLKINQNNLAELLDMPASKISQILNKKRPVDVDFLKGIYTKLGIDGNSILNAI